MPEAIALSERMSAVIRESGARLDLAAEHRLITEILALMRKGEHVWLTPMPQGAGPELRKRRDKAIAQLVMAEDLTLQQAADKVGEIQLNVESAVKNALRSQRRG